MQELLLLHKYRKSQLLVLLLKYSIPVLATTLQKLTQTLQACLN